MAQGTLIKIKPDMNGRRLDDWTREKEAVRMKVEKKNRWRTWGSCRQSMPLRCRYWPALVLPQCAGVYRCRFQCVAVDGRDERCLCHRIKLQTLLKCLSFRARCVFSYSRLFFFSLLSA